MRRALLLIYMILLAGILFGCASAAPAKKKETQPPQTKMTPDDFVNLYVDLSIVAEKFLEDSVRLAQAQDSVFKLHNVTRQRFEEFRKMIDEDPQKWGFIWQKIIKKLEELDKKNSESTIEEKSEPAKEKSGEE